MLLSIIIPTYNRYDSLLKIIEFHSKFNDEQNIEFIISDNSESPKNILPQGNINLKVVWHRERLSMGQNIEKGIESAQGEFVMVIGDDDFLNPNIVAHLKHILSGADIDVVTYPRANYYWPGSFVPRRGDLISPSTLMINNQYTKKHSIKSSKDSLTNLIKKSAMYIDDMPSLYHGIIRRRLLLQWQKKYGKLTLGPSPDISYTALILTNTKEYVFFDLPLSIPGASATSAAAIGRVGGHFKYIDEMPNWYGDVALFWPKGLPKVWSGKSIYFVSVLSVLKIVGHKYYYSLLDDVRKVHLEMYTEDLKSIYMLPFNIKEINHTLLKWMISVARSSLTILPLPIGKLIYQRHSLFKTKKFIKLEINNLFEYLRDM